MRPKADRSCASSEKRFALITGASSGLGRALVQTAEGYRLIATGRDEESLASLPADVTIAADLCRLEERQKVIEAIRRFVPEIVINNAGFGLYGDALSLDTKEQLRMVEVNASALLELTLEAAHALKAEGRSGTILNVASASAFFPFPAFAVYAASKAFVRSFSLALDFELKKEGIRVLVCSPGQISTPFRLHASQGKSSANKSAMPIEKAAARIWRQIALGKGEVVFDWKYRAGVFLAHFLPKTFLLRRFYSAIKARV